MVTVDGQSRANVLVSCDRGLLGYMFEADSTQHTAHSAVIDEVIMFEWYGNAKKVILNEFVVCR